MMNRSTEGDLRNRKFRGFDGAILLRLARAHDWLFAVTGMPLRRFRRSAGKMRCAPLSRKDQREGRTLSVDLDRMEGRLALRKAGTGPCRPLPKRL